VKGGVKLFGVGDMIDNLKTVGGDVQKSSRKAVFRGGAHLEKALKRKLNQKGTGRKYGKTKEGRWYPWMSVKKGGRYETHVASAPGQPPAVDTGRLRSSITHNVTGRVGSSLPDPGGSKERVRGYVGTNVEYGYWLERGAMIHPFGNLGITVPLLPRPWMLPTFEEEGGQVAKIVRSTLAEAIKKAKMK